jgi:hypothetical protein
LFCWDGCSSGRLCRFFLWTTIQFVGSGTSDPWLLENVRNGLSRLSSPPEARNSDLSRTNRIAASNSSDWELLAVKISTMCGSRHREPRNDGYLSAINKHSEQAWENKYFMNNRRKRSSLMSSPLREMFGRKRKRRTRRKLEIRWGTQKTLNTFGLNETEDIRMAQGPSCVSRAAYRRVPRRVLETRAALNNNTFTWSCP